MGATSRSAKSSTASSTNVTAKPARQIDLTRPHRLAEREQRDDHEHPADRVVEEGGSRVQPPVRLVDEEGHAGGEQREARHERPQRAVQLPAYDRELHGAGDERRLRPDGVGEQVHRRERREDGDQPQPDGRRDDDRREQIGAPGTTPEDLRADDHLGDEHEPDEQRDRRREPVGQLSPRDHATPLPRDPRSALGRSRTCRRARPGRRGAAPGRGSRRRPGLLAPGSTIRYGWATAHTRPTTIVIGPRSWIASARHGRRSTACSASSFGMLDAISEFTRYLPPRVWRARATLRKALFATRAKRSCIIEFVRLRIVGSGSRRAAAAASVAVVALASTSAAGLPSYTERLPRRGRASTRSRSRGAARPARTRA